MFYEIAHFFQNRVPFVWNCIEGLNSVLFSLRYRKGLQSIPDVLSEYEDVFAIDDNDVENLVEFFASQPEESFRYFNPHKFDADTIRKLVARKSFLMFAVKDSSGSIIGYFFLRCFFMGKAFLGRMVDFRFQGKGIGKKMNRCAMDVASSLWIRMFETVSRDNLASLYSVQRALETRVLKEFDNGDLYIEDLWKIEQ